MNTGTFILLIGVGSLMVIMIFVTIFRRYDKQEPKKKGRIDIVTDELDRHKRENYHLKA